MFIFPYPRNRLDGAQFAGVDRRTCGRAKDEPEKMNG